jgi:hypothetical protein
VSPIELFEPKQLHQTSEARFTTLSTIEFNILKLSKANMPDTCTLEEFFSDDDDVPQHYICNTFTHAILVEPVLLNGRLYESHKINEWVANNKTDPFTRERVASTKVIQPILKSAIGLDAFMRKKVENVYSFHYC